MWTRNSHLRSVGATQRSLPPASQLRSQVTRPRAGSPLTSPARSAWSRAALPLASLPLLCAVGCLPVNGIDLASHDDPTALDLDGDGWTLATGDCNDHDAQVHPTQLELCDGLDNNCNGAADEGLAQEAWFPDRDGDGSGDDRGLMLSCAAPSGYVASAGDCDDTNASTYPQAAEQCDGLDNDCNDLVDEGLPVATYYADGDGDGFGAGDHLEGCARPAGYADGHGDCNDADASIHPGAEDPAGDSIDQDCGGFDGPQPHVGLSATSAPSLQAALNAARDGETIWVGPGRYLEAGLSFRGRAVILETTCGPLSSIVDAVGQGSVVLLTSSEGPGTVIRGFTLTGGRAEKGAGIYMSGVSATLEDLVIDGNVAVGDGGGIYAVDSTAQVTGCSLYGNFARRGGGLFVTGSSPTFNSCAFAANAAIWGGGLYAGQATLNIASSTFSANHAVASGGGLLAWQSSLELDHDTWVGNDARGGGGVALWASTGNLTSSRLSGNTAAFGGGALLMNSQPALEDSAFSENQARFLGGGLYLSGSSASLVRLNVEDNQAVGVQGALGVGGGIFIQKGLSMSIAGSRIVGNSASGYGGGIAMNGSSPTLENSMLLDNSAGVLGGGLLIAGDSTPRVSGSILAWNERFNLYLEVAAAGVPHPTVVYSDLYAPEDGLNHNLSELDASNFTVDPRFQAYDAAGMPADYHLAVDSPLKDAGDPAVKDIDGSRSDLGSYGGPTGGQWDVDGDGWFDYFWAGTVQDAPAGINAAAWDCDDQDAAVGGCG